MDPTAAARSPHDEAPIVPPPTPDEAALEALVARARAATGAWAALGLRERSRRMKRAARAMLEDVDAVLGLMRHEIGKHEVDGLMSEAVGPLDQVTQWTRLMRRHLGPRRARVNPLGFPGKRAWVELVPRGVVLAITPWNYPLGTFYRPVLPALLAGNTVVVKPSEHAPRTAAWFVEHLQREVGEDVVVMAAGDGAVGRALLGMDIDACTFTGSVAAGREVARICGERLVPLSAELGGNDAALVLADCDLDRTLAGVAHWALQNAGQNCGAIERVFVEEAIAEPFVARLADAFSRLEVGPGPADAVDVSPLANEAQLAVVERHVADARERGARVVCGGERTGRGLGYRPTVLDGCTPEMAVMREETFGPVVAVARVADAEEGLRRANDSRYGLGASVWTRDLARGRALVQRIECGVGSVNNHAVSGAIVTTPWTGTKDSGSGVANSAWALTTFARPRTTLVDRSSKPDLFWLPFDGTLLDVGRRIAALQTGRWTRALKLPLLVRRRIRAIRAFFAPSEGRDDRL